MKILLLSLDGIGDLVLRQPLVSALLSAGHTIGVVCRPASASAIPFLAPVADVFVLDADPYRGDFGRLRSEIRRIIATARTFAPDLVVACQYQRTYACEQIALGLRPATLAGFDGRFYTEHPAASSPEYKLDQVISVPEEMPEPDKNQALCGALLGHPVELAPSRADVPARVKEEAARLLASAGVEPGGYWLSCVGEASGRLKTTRPEHWAQLLGNVLERSNLPVVFAGSEEDRPHSESALALLASRGFSGTVHCFGGNGLDELFGLAALAAGYIGRDGGPMQVAAALGKPVIAAFSGGCWPRFVPRAQAGICATVGVPCLGCDWRCPFAEPYCITTLPPDALAAGLDSAMHVSVHQPPTDLLVHMGREAVRRTAADSAYRKSLERDLTARLQAAEQANALLRIRHAAERQVNRELETRHVHREAELRHLLSQLAAPAANGADTANAAGPRLRRVLSSVRAMLRSLTEGS